VTGPFNVCLRMARFFLAGNYEHDRFHGEQQGRSGSDRLARDVLVSAPIETIVDDAFARQGHESCRGVLVGRRFVEFEMAIRAEPEDCDIDSPASTTRVSNASLAAAGLAASPGSRVILVSGMSSGPMNKLIIHLNSGRSSSPASAQYLPSETT
jgi:hypothetical protein